MNLKNSSIRLRTIECLQDVVTTIMPQLNNELKCKLRPQERLLWAELQKLTWLEGNWYRPHHNFIVTATMNQFCQQNPIFGRGFLMSLAMLHDIGYTKLQIAKQGQDWNSVEKRKAHMKFGAEMYKEIIEQMEQEGTYSINRFDFDEEDGPWPTIEMGVEIIGTHDNPYIGEELPNISFAHILRDMDRLYVCSFSSFVKDYINYLDKEQGLTPLDFVQRTVYYFIQPEDQNPLQTLMPNLTSQFKEEKFEAYYTDFAFRLWQQQIYARGEETAKHDMFSMDLNDFQAFARIQLLKESKLILNAKYNV